MASRGLNSPAGHKEDRDDERKNIDTHWDEEWRGNLVKTPSKISTQYSTAQFVFDLDV